MSSQGGLANGNAEEENAGDAAAKIKEEEIQVRKMQDWWGSERGPAAVSMSPMLSVIEAPVLAEIVSAGGGYHNILTSDRLDGLHRQVGGSTDPALEALRKALQSRGGSKAQARCVGMVLFREARALCERCELDGSCSFAQMPDSAVAPGLVASIATPARAQTVQDFSAAAPSPEASPIKNSASAAASVRLDEVWSPPRRFVCADSYPEGAQMAIRVQPDKTSDMVTQLPAGSEYLATGCVGEYLQIQLDVNGSRLKVYCLRSINDLVLLVPDLAPGALDEEWAVPRRYVKGQGYPEGAQMAAKTGPSRDSQQLCVLPPDFDYLATGRSGDYLRIQLESDGKIMSAFVLHTLGGDQVLLTPALSAAPPSASSAHAEAAAAYTVAAQAAQAAAAAASNASDARIELLERQVQVLQIELAQMRSQFSAAAAAFSPPSN